MNDGFFSMLNLKITLHALFIIKGNSTFFIDIPVCIRLYDPHTQGAGA